MPRKRRKDVAEEIKKPTKYGDKTPRWLQELVDEEEKRWYPPKRIHLQFSEKDEEKEAMKRDFWKRKAQRTGSGR